MSVWVGPTGENPNPHIKGGTSFSSPFVAGVLAMIMAADPSVSPTGAKPLLDTAELSADETVSRIVDAVGVMDVTDNRLGPLVEISQADAKPLYGGFNTDAEGDRRLDRPLRSARSSGARTRAARWAPARASTTSTSRSASGRSPST